MVEKYDLAREAASITLDKVSSWEDLNAATEAEADRKFSDKTRELWNENRHWWIAQCWR